MKLGYIDKCTMYNNTSGLCFNFLMLYFRVIYLTWSCVFNCSHYYWSKAFPLYGRDYGSVLEAIERMEKELPGYFYAGNLFMFK